MSGINKLIDRITNKMELERLKGENAAQAEELSHKKEALGSLARLAKAIVQSPEYLKEQIPNSYTFFRPTDQVGGDFFWCEKTATNEHMIIVADCTGHGLEGSGMAIAANLYLNQFVLPEPDIFSEEFKQNPSAVEKNHVYPEPHQVISYLDYYVDQDINNVNRPGTEKSYNTLELQVIRYNHAKQIIEISGSKSDIIIYRHEENKIYVIKGNSDPVGANEEGTFWNTFTQHKAFLEAGDQFYANSDGVPDLQTPPEQGSKRLTTAGFHKIITETSPYEMDVEGPMVVDKLKEFSGNFAGAKDDISLLIVEIPDNAQIPERGQVGKEWLLTLNPETNTYGPCGAKIKTYDCVAIAEGKKVKGNKLNY